jgi:hypothetical protein
MRSKSVDIVMVILIVLYTILVFIFFGLEEVLIDTAPNITFILQVVELCILGVFVLEISLYLYAYRRIYIDDKWNFFDLIIIVVSIAMVILEMVIDNDAL